MDVNPNWWESFFDSTAADMWANVFSPQQNDQEAEEIVRTLNVAPGSEVLDVPCGAGRLSLALAAKGYRVTGVDVSRAFLDRARAGDRDASVQWQQRDMRDLPWPGRFDAAFCVGNSFGYLDDDGNAAFLSAVHSTLKPGAPFLLETPMVIESLLRTMKDRFWIKAGDVHLLVANEYDHGRGRVEIEYTFVSNGRVQVRWGTHRAYTYRQLVELMESAGFRVEPAARWTIDSAILRLVGRA